MYKEKYLKYKTKSTYFINPGNGEIIDKAFKNFIMTITISFKSSN